MHLRAGAACERTRLHLYEYTFDRGEVMEFDSRNDGWAAARDRHARLGGPWLLALGLALLAVATSVLVLTTPTWEEKPVIHAARLP
jgi:hypothetical protein